MLYNLSDSDDMFVPKKAAKKNDGKPSKSVEVPKKSKPKKVETDDSEDEVKKRRKKTKKKESDDEDFVVNKKTKSRKKNDSDDEDGPQKSVRAGRTTKKTNYMFDSDESD